MIDLYDIYRIQCRHGILAVGTGGHNGRVSEATQ